MFSLKDFSSMFSFAKDSERAQRFAKQSVVPAAASLEINSLRATGQPN